jgi:hypothetical protein
MHRTSLRGEVATGILIGLAAAALVAFVFKGTKLGGESRRAERSEDATARLTDAVASVDAAQEAKGAAAAASVTQIGVAAGELPPDSKAGKFIAREVPLALSYLPQPDPKALLEAEKRRLAVTEGRLAEANRLYEKAYAEADKAKALAAKAESERDAALAERRAADAAISEAAAANRALARRSIFQWLGIGLLALAAGYLWLTGISPRTIGQALSSIRAGEETPVQAFDRLLPAWMHKRVHDTVLLSTPLPEDKTATTPTTAPRPAAKRKPAANTRASGKPAVV